MAGRAEKGYAAVCFFAGPLEHRWYGGLQHERALKRGIESITAAGQQEKMRGGERDRGQVEESRRAA